MKIKIGFTLAVIICFILGFTFKQDPYTIRTIGSPADQLALNHRDSAYSHVSWITSDSANYAQLRFMDRIEGGVCLRPSWDDYAQLSQNKPELKHLVPEKPWTARGKPGHDWPKDKAHPSPGTLSNTRYVCLFPTAVLLNKSVMKAANGNPREAKPNIIIVGLGSAIGISVFAHHFPEASITVVDIDQVVLDMVYDHYPFIEWLSKQSCSDGRPRLKIDCGDARQYMHYPEMRNDNGIKYDVAILDAYTSGSTIPSHLMTQEFFEEIKNILTPDGILMSNIIGSYTGKKKYVVGGAMRSQQAAGFTHVHNFPIISHPYHTEYLFNDPSFGQLDKLNPENARNNIILASAETLDPSGNKAGWELLRQFTPYAGLNAGQYVTEEITLVKHNFYQHQKYGDIPYAQQYLSSSVALPKISNASLQKIRLQSKQDLASYLKGKPTLSKSDDYQRSFHADIAVINECNDKLKETWGDRTPMGWDQVKNASAILYRKTDWVLFARRTFQRSVRAALSRGSFGYIHSGDNIVGRANGEGRKSSMIPDAPLYTDAQPNADIYNR